MKYLITMRPMEPYMFGTDQTFSDSKMKTNRKISYFATSGEIPEQTTILGALRYLLLLEYGTLKQNFRYSPEDLQKNAEIIGKDSFSFFTDEQSFGKIRSISSVFVLKKKNNQTEFLVPTPYFLMPGKTIKDFVELKMSDCPVETSFGTLLLPEKNAYDAKTGKCGGWFNLDTHKLENSIFSKVVNTCSSSAQDFFKKEMCIMDKDYCFAVYADIDAKLPENYVGKMGRGSSAFHFCIKEITADEVTLNKRVENGFKNFKDTWYYALSDLLPNESFQLQQFCIIEKKSVRNVVTNSEKSQFLSVAPHQVNMITAGSVFYGEPRIELRKNGGQIGYNQIIKIGGTSKMHICLLKLKCLTNLHVGNGEVNYSIVDNEVERDPVTGLPTINASGVKGALRAFFANSKDLVSFFGEANSKEQTCKTGKIKFFPADMLGRAMRGSSGKKSFYVVTTKDALSLLKEKLNAFGFDIRGAILEETEENMEAEGHRLLDKCSIAGETLYIMDNRDFDEVALPCIARNFLENGTSKNLWYEEVVPHQSVFTLLIGADSKDDLDEFVKYIDGNVVQFGGNSTVGCGYCKVTKIDLEAKK